MWAMILAAGRGLRMGNLTEKTPKPLLKIGGRYLIEYAITALAKIGIKDVVINVSYLREQIQSALGDGSAYGIRIHYSIEPEVLETGGGIFQALPLLAPDPFIVISSDIISDYPLENLPKNPSSVAHLILVPNPDFHPTGDFNLEENRVVINEPHLFTYANIGVFRPELFAHCQPGKFRLGDLLKQAARQNQITGECFNGLWHNIGTPDQLDIQDCRL